MSNMLRALRKKADNMQRQMENASREVNKLRIKRNF